MTPVGPTPAWVRGVHAASRLTGVFAAGLILVSVGVICQMVFVRAVLGQSSIWQTEFVTFAIVGATFLGAPYILLTRGYVAVDVLPLMVGMAARRRMMAEIPKADVIVTNPTHYAVALRYKSGSMRAPKVVGKGVHLLAARIREIAQEHRIPIVEAPPLARALYYHTELESEIPETLYTAVAEVLAYVFQLRRYNEYGGVAPKPPLELPVPADMDHRPEAV